MSTSIYGPGGIGKTPETISMPKSISSWDDVKKIIKKYGVKNVRFNSWEDVYKEVEKIRKESRTMNKFDFVNNLFLEARIVEPMDIKTAEDDLKMFRYYAETDPGSGWEDMPDDLTPTEYMEIWNKLLEEQNKAAAEWDADHPFGY